jgi:hypothetical protein
MDFIAREGVLHVIAKIEGVAVRSAHQPFAPSEQALPITGFVPEVGTAEGD